MAYLHEALATEGNLRGT